MAAQSIDCYLAATATSPRSFSMRRRPEQHIGLSGRANFYRRALSLGDYPRSRAPGQLGSMSASSPSPRRGAREVSRCLQCDLRLTPSVRSCGNECLQRSRN